MSPASAPDPDVSWPGRELGLPESGPRSIARLGRRIGALAIDWGIALVLSFAFFRVEVDGAAETNPLVTLAIFAVLQFVFLLVVNGGVGHLVLGMRVVPVRGGYLGPWRPFVRTVLLCLAIPAVIWDRDQRGLHDLAAGTVLVRV